MKPSIRAIIWNDFPALASAIGIAMVWVLYFGFPLLKGIEREGYLLLIPGIATPLLFLVLAWRIQRIKAIFAKGVEARGNITAIRLVKDRGRLEFAYVYGENSFHAWLPVHKTKRVLGFQVGQPVVVLIDAANPNSAIVKELFE
jgi:hypothetical protein